MLIYMLSPTRVLCIDHVETQLHINRHHDPFRFFPSQSPGSADPSDSNDQPHIVEEQGLFIPPPSVKRLSVYALDPSSTDIMLKGRDICVFLTDSVISKLPEGYRTQMTREGSVVLDLVPALFTQGIDLQQSVASSSWMSSSSASSLSLQYRLNLQGLTVLNSYCHALHPVSADPFSEASGDHMPPPHPSLNESEDTYIKSQSDLSSQALNATTTDNNTSEPTPTLLPIHPICSQLRNILQITLTKSHKNVDLLAEIECISLLLNACRVTFCKSGKDRTGIYQLY